MNSLYTFVSFKTIRLIFLLFDLIVDGRINLKSIDMLLIFIEKE